MSKKKHKARPVGASTQKAGQTLQTADKVKRMKPAARSLLMLALVFLAAGELLYRLEIISYAANAVSLIAALILVIGAVLIQFSGLDRYFGKRKL